MKVSYGSLQCSEWAPGWTVITCVFAVTAAMIAARLYALREVELVLEQTGPITRAKWCQADKNLVNVALYNTLLKKIFNYFSRLESLHAPVACWLLWPFHGLTGQNIKYSSTQELGQPKETGTIKLVLFIFIHLHRWNRHSPIQVYGQELQCNLSKRLSSLGAHGGWEVRNFGTSGDLEVENSSEP